MTQKVFIVYGQSGHLKSSMRKAAKDFFDFQY